MQKLDSSLALRVGNAIIEPMEDCSFYKATAAKLMIGPETARLSALQEAGLVYVPLPEINIELYTQPIFDIWKDCFEQGICLLEDFPYGELDQPDPQLRFSNCARLVYESARDFYNNGGFPGRFFLWIDFPKVLLNRSFLEFSGFCCPPDQVGDVFGKSLRELVEEFSAFAEQSNEKDGREFYVRLAQHYSQQWALA